MEMSIRKFLFLLILLTASVLRAEVTFKVYDHAGNQLGSDREVMVDEEYIISVASDTNEPWGAGLFIEGDEREEGTLYAKGNKDPNSRDWPDSHFQAAGEDATVFQWFDSVRWGYDLQTCPFDRDSGTWFAIEYVGNEVADCNVGIYEHSISWVDPNDYIVFNNVPTRNLVKDSAVDFKDFEHLASRLGVSCPNDPNYADGADINRDGIISLKDLDKFNEYWMWGIAPQDNNDVQTDPNIVYSILDANDNNNITMDVNDTITLYVNKQTEDANVYMFEIEVKSSDYFLGSIDNRYVDTSDPNDPNNGTARILMKPRSKSEDYIGPGEYDANNLGLKALTFDPDNPAPEGHIASFQYSALAEGSVILSVINKQAYENPTLETMVISQVEPNQMEGSGSGTESMETMTMSTTDSTMTTTTESTDSGTSEPTCVEQDVYDASINLWYEEPAYQLEYTEEEWQEYIDSIMTVCE